MDATLNAQPREGQGKGAARTLRREGRVPGVIYGHGDETRHLSIDGLELEKLLSRISVENTLIEVKIGRKKPVRALIREVQRHPVRPGILHVDFYQIHAGEKIHLDVPVRVTGTAIGVREEGGVLQQVRHELEVICLPSEIPEKIEVDVSGLHIGESIHVGDLDLPNVEIVAEDDLTLVTVVAPTVAAEPEDAEAEAAEPELVGREGEEEEEEGEESEDREERSEEAS